MVEWRAREKPLNRHVCGRVGKGRHTGIGVKCLWRGEGVESVVMMYGA